MTRSPTPRAGRRRPPEPSQPLEVRRLQAELARREYQAKVAHRRTGKPHPYAVATPPHRPGRFAWLSRLLARCRRWIAERTHAPAPTRRGPDAPDEPLPRATPSEPPEWVERGRIAIDRAIAYLPLSSARTRRVLVCAPGPFPSPSGGHVAWESRHLLEGGLDVRILASAGARTTGLDSSERLLMRRARSYAANEASAAKDLAFWEQKNPEGLATVQRWVGTPPELLTRMLAFARAGAALRPRYVHGFGVADSGSIARGAAALLNVPYGITITGREARAPHGNLEQRVALLRDAAVVTVDCANTAETVLQITGGAVQHLNIKAPAVFWEPPRLIVPKTTPRALIAPPIHRGALVQLADAVKQVHDGGSELEVEMLGKAKTAPGSARDILGARLAEHGLEHLMMSPPEDDATPLRDHVARASMLVALHRHRDEPDTAGIAVAVLAAMAAGLPIVAHRGGALEEVIRDQEEGLLVDPSDVRGLARAIARLATDADLRRTLGTAAGERFESEYSPDASGAAMRSRIRTLLGIERRRNPQR
ncbi:MAG: glycosyltransferase [Planctomycetota bacterium]